MNVRVQNAAVTHTAMANAIRFLAIDAVFGVIVDAIVAAAATLAP
jgi:hypothetical protein